MLQNNFSFNSTEKKSTNNTTLISDDKFISLINNLSDIIRDYYYATKNNIDDIFNILLEYEENNTKAFPKFFKKIEKQQQNLNYFIEQAKQIFKKMSIYKNAQKNAFKSNTSSNFKNLTNIKSNNYNVINKSNKINTNNKNVIEFKITSKFSTEDDKNKIINNTYNAYNTNIYNKSDHKYSNINSNLENIKSLIQKLSLYENIISKVSLKSKENFRQLENDIIFLIDKCIFVNDNGRNSLKNNNSFYNNEINNNANNINENNNNYSFNYNKSWGLGNENVPKKNLINDFNPNNELDDLYKCNKKITELKMKNNLYKEKIKDLEFQIDDIKSTIIILENTLNDANNEIDLMKKQKDNVFYDNESINYINENYLN